MPPLVPTTLLANDRFSLPRDPGEYVYPATWMPALDLNFENNDNELLRLPELNERPRVGLFGDRPWIVDGPSIPEPMVFDMVRPMHARRGELEVNVLTVVPLNRRLPVDWAPEIEIAIADGVALEFELPFDDLELESLKGAVQYTFGVGFDNKLIHGFHGIYEYFFDGDLSQITGLYLVGLQLDDTWSVMTMFGFRSNIVGEAQTHFTELIQNVSVFAQLSDNVIVGMETNMSHELSGPSSVLLVPQVHWELNEQFSIQYGGGILITAEEANPVAAARIIWER